MTALNLPNPFKIEQGAEGYRYSIEPFLLADFVQPQPGCRILDVGTGCGIIPLLLMTYKTADEIVAVEIQKSLYDTAVRNMSQNDALGKIRLIHSDFIKVDPDTVDGLFDLILSNPPYRKINTGRRNANQEKTVARHELVMDLKSLAAKSNSLLKEGGILALAYPPIRLAETLEQLRAHQLYPNRLRFVHGYESAEACIFLVEATKERQVDCIVEPPLHVYNKDGSYSSEMEEIYASFNCSSRTNHVKEKRNGSRAR